MAVCDLDSRTQPHTLMIPKKGIHRIINLAWDMAPSNSSSGKPDIRVFEITGSQYTKIKQNPPYRNTSQNSKLMSESDCSLSLLADISEKKIDRKSTRLNSSHT